MKLSSPYSFSQLDMEKLCRNYRQTGQGTDVPMGNKAAAIAALGQVNNRLLGRYGRPLFWMAQPILSPSTTQADSVGSDPNSLYIWRHHDGVPNARNHTVHFNAAYRAAGSGDAYAERAGGGPSTEETVKTQITHATLDLCSHTYGCSYPVARGAAADADVTDGLITYNGFTALDVFVQDDMLKMLDTSLHDYADPSVAKTGKSVLAESCLEDVRRTFHSLRTENLPILFCWAAICPAAGYGTPASTLGTGIVIDEAVNGTNTYANIMNTGLTTRTATSVGLPCPGYMMGVGPELEDAGRQVKVQCACYASSATSNSTLKIIGPDTWANNHAEILINGGAGWYATDEIVYLDSHSQDTDATTARNKLDFHGKIAGSGGGTDKGYIYMVVGWMKT